jgi:hypothetical protein
MRRVRTVQASIFDVFAAHEIGRELKAMSQWLDEHRDLLGLVATDLGQHGVKVACHQIFIQRRLEPGGLVIRHRARCEQRTIGGAGRGCAADRPLR